MIIESLETPNNQYPWWGKLIMWCVLTIFLSLSSCTVLTSFDDAEVTKAESEAQQIRTEALVRQLGAKLALEKQRLEALETLVKDHNFGPVAARCAILGWDGMSDREICEHAEAIHAAKQK